jgi:hypothetical protein
MNQKRKKEANMGGVPDKLSLPGLADIKERTDSEVVRLWLADRGFVAVERVLMETLAAHDTNSIGIVYHAGDDYYLKRERAAEKS